VTEEGGTARRHGTGVLWALGLGTAILVGTRVAARQLTPWEWDDLVFSLALDTFAPQSQVPHPPFYPGFVLLGRLMRLLVGDAHAALTWVSVLASILAPGFLFLVARELGLTRGQSALAGWLLAFFPAVWLHAGVPLSDPAGLAAGLGTLWLALRGRRSFRLALVAASVFGVAFAIRPQATLPAAVGLVLAAWPGGWRRRLVVGGAAIASVGVCYLLPIVLAAGDVTPVWRWTRYQTTFVLEQDSLAAHHWAVGAMARRAFVDIWASPVLAVIVLGVAALGVVGLRRQLGKPGTWVVIAIFLPTAVLTWTLLDPATAGRYALPYLPLVALLVAVGGGLVDRALQLGRWPVTSMLLTATMAAVVAPSVWLVHRQASPPVAAADAIRAEAGGAPARVVFLSALRMHAHAFFAGAELVSVRKPEDLCSIPLGVGTWAYGLTVPDGQVASWPDLPALRRVGRGRYLRVPWGPMREACIRFGTGFFPEERTSDGNTFRWMGERGTVSVQPARADLRLEIEAVLPAWAPDQPPQVSFSLNGSTLETMRVEGRLLRHTAVIPAARLHQDRANELEITTSRTTVPAEGGSSLDRRRLGLQVRTLSVRLAPSLKGSDVPAGR
jgi:hypothetical protein